MRIRSTESVVSTNGYACKTPIYPVLFVTPVVVVPELLKPKTVFATPAAVTSILEFTDVPVNCDSVFASIVLEKVAAPEPNI
jgi:hypothetical protein